MSDYTFETPEPIQLLVSIGKGQVELRATTTAQTRVELTGPDADQVAVSQDGRLISVVAPRQRTGFLGREPEVYVLVVLPEGSDVQTRTGSADTVAQGTFATCRLRSGSGDITFDTATGPLVVESGSGDLTIERAVSHLRAKAGSGDVRIGRCESSTVVSTGSGDVAADYVEGKTVVKTGSADVSVTECHGEVSLTSGSGDLLLGAAQAGRVVATSASGDVQVGVPSGLPVWTDISTVSGDISSNLASTGEPSPGQDHLELRAKTVSGDIALRQC